jgi:hypothetical protein
MPPSWRWALAALLACALVGAVVGNFATPPGGVEGGSSGAKEKVGILVKPVDGSAMVRARVPTAKARVPNGTSYGRFPGQEYGGWIFATADNQETALNRAASSALRYVRALTRREDRLMRSRSPSPQIRDLQRAVMRQPTRFQFDYAPVAAGAPAISYPEGPWRTALIGALAGLLLLCIARLARRPTVSSGNGAARLGAWEAPGGSLARAVGLATAGLALAAAAAALATAASVVYTVFLVGLLFAASFAFTEADGRRAIRILVAVVIVSSALRGALLGLGNAINLPNGLTTVNAIQPAIIAGCAVAVLLERRGRFPRHARPLLVGWAMIAGVAIVDFATQTVGYNVYAIGLAQYLTYPTLAILAWLAMERGDSERIVRLFVIVGGLIAVSVLLEAVHLVHFVEAAAPNGDVAVGARYGGATGSYLHASMFMGTTAVLAMGLMLQRWRQRQALITAGLLALMFGAMALTLSRGGFAIAAVGALMLIVRATRQDRRRLVAAMVGVLALALVLGFAGGVAPGKLGSRLSSGLNASGDPGNELRFKRMGNAFDHFKGLPIGQKLAGEGLAATGNARTVALLPAIPTESYPLKLLLEVGVLGSLVIGAYLLWALWRFGKASIGGPNWLIRGAAAAGIGLSLYGALYPTLEVQLLAMTWWVLLVVCLGAERFRSREDERHVRDEPASRKGPRPERRWLDAG